MRITDVYTGPRRQAFVAALPTGRAAQRKYSITVFDMWSGTLIFFGIVKGKVGACKVAKQYVGSPHNHQRVTPKKPVPGPP